VYNALCPHFLKARAPDLGLEPFLSPSKIAKRLEPSSPEPRIRSTTSSRFVGGWPDLRITITIEVLTEKKAVFSNVVPVQARVLSMPPIDVSVVNDAHLVPLPEQRGGFLSLGFNLLDDF
jgi:hypothetical protein